MIKDTLLLFWIFIFPILAWMSRFFLSQKKRKVGFSQKAFLRFFFFMEFLLLGFGLPFVISFGDNLQKDLSMFCWFQIVGLDMYFSFLLVTNWWEYLPKKLEIKLDNLKGYKLFILVFLWSVLWCLSLSFSMLLVFFRSASLWEIFTDQKLPFVLVIFILLFNPIYMFYQLKERLSKDG